MSISTGGYNAIKRTDTTDSSQYYVIGDKKTTTEKVVGSGLVDTSQLREIKTELGQDAFMQILIAQLANQDPMQPMSDTDFIAQMAQFSALEQMQALNATFKSSQAYNYVGKGIIATTNILNEETGEWEETIMNGIVEGIEFHNDKPYLIVGDYLLEPDSVNQIYDANGAGSSSSLESNILQSGSLVGKYVTANVQNASEEIVEVSGQVEKIIVKNGYVYAQLDNGQEVAVVNITSIDDEPATGSGSGDSGENAGSEGTDNIEQA